VGAGAVATGLLEQVRETAGIAEAQAKKTSGPGEVSMTLNVNGKDRALKAEPRVTLLDALRNRLDTTGAKKVCDRATCGACTVLMDDQVVYSCTVLAIEAQGHKIVTPEGLGTPEKMHAVQDSFVEHDAHTGVHRRDVRVRPRSPQGDARGRARRARRQSVPLRDVRGDYPGGV
jgi:xanthine dehydrogenase YagT iron-sulfur-binding subunit